MNHLNLILSPLLTFDITGFCWDKLNDVSKNQTYWELENFQKAVSIKLCLPLQFDTVK